MRFDRLGASAALIVVLTQCATPAASLRPECLHFASRRAAAFGSALALSTTLKPQEARAALAEKVGEDGRLVLTDSTAATLDVVASPPKITSRCYLDVTIGDTPAGRMEIDVYGDVAPKAAENFRCLCTGEKGFGYAGSSFFKVLSGAVAQGGEIEGRSSIYGEPFAHDNYLIKHNVRGLVSMVNTGVGGSSGLSDSRFLIQLPDDAGFLDGRYEAFGRVVSGTDVLGKIEQVKVKGTKNTPVERVAIVSAGELPL